MPKQKILLIEFRELPQIRVAQRLCLFALRTGNPDKKVRKAFRELREWILSFGLIPDDLLHIGIPTLEENKLVMYECCIEFPLPIEEDQSKIKLKTLVGGKYIVLTVEKDHKKIQKSIRQFRGDYIPEHQIITDENRSIFEIYYDDYMEYCVPILS